LLAIAAAESPEQYRLYVYEGLSICPAPEQPLRAAMAGTRRLDCVPVCFKRPCIFKRLGPSRSAATETALGAGVFPT
jgi:hypothetical protein